MAEELAEESAGESVGKLAETLDWVVWNGSLGVSDLVTIGRVEIVDGVRLAYLGRPTASSDRSASTNSRAKAASLSAHAS